MKGRRLKMGMAAGALGVVVWVWVRSWGVADVMWVQRGAGNSVAAGMSEGRVFAMWYVPTTYLSSPSVRVEAASFPVGRSARYPVMGRQETGATWAARVGLERVRMIGPWSEPAGGAPGALLPAYPQMVLGRGVYVPHWLICLLSAAALGRLGWKEWAHWKAGRQGLCRRCGYDLRATPERCPECGEMRGG